MNKTRQPEAVPRGSAQAWLDSAYDSLVESGIDAVRITPLSRRLGLARTSFYWFFNDREQLLGALIEQWRAKNTGNLIRRSEDYAETVVEATLNVFDCWFDRNIFDSAFEFAVRSWALQSPPVAAEVHAADARRLEALTRMFMRFGSTPLVSDVRARTLYLTQIGYISMETRESIAMRMRRIPQYVEIFTGLVPAQREIDRFFARHSTQQGDWPASRRRHRTRMQ